MTPDVIERLIEVTRRYWIDEPPLPQAMLSIQATL